MTAICLIVALDSQNGIGKNNTLSWKLKKDMRFFREITTSPNLSSTFKKYEINFSTQIPSSLSQSTSSPQNSLIMGNNTWKSLPTSFRPLPERKNIVLSRLLTQKDNCPPYTATNIPTALSLCHPKSYKFIIGGEQIYKLALQNPSLQYLIVTSIKNNFDCDTFFPTIPKEFQKIGMSNIQNENDLEFQFLVYQKVVLS